jgi:hypothetical protein
MTAEQFIQDIKGLHEEKGLECPAESVRVLLGVSQDLSRRGIATTRELLDFTIDVIRAKALAGLSSDSSPPDWDEGKEKMIEWLEAMGWRRSWFTRPLAGAF